MAPRIDGMHNHVHMCSLMVANTFVSFRTTPEESARLKRVAAAHGVSLQGLMQELVRERLGAEREPPTLPRTIALLRERKDDLAGWGVSRLWVFGSTARGEASGGSDVDLIVELAETSRLSLTGFARLRSDIQEWLGYPVDLAEWCTLEPRLAAAASREAVNVF